MADKYAAGSAEDFLSRIGSTPLIKFEKLSAEIKRNVYFKAEYYNPGHSIKDRAVKYLIADALARDPKLTTISECTAGNTGVALALLARAQTPPLSVKLFVPDSLIEDKITLLRDLGCEVVKCPIDVPTTSPLFFNNQAIAYAESHENTVHLNQMDNTSNRRAHYTTTGPEIFKDLHGKVDGFTASAGTGGTLMGVGSFLKEANPKVVVWAADRFGSGLTSYVKSHGDNWESEGESFVEGIGKKSLTGQMSDLLDVVDDAVTITDTETVKIIYELFQDQGVWIGPSAGLNIAAAKALALSLPEGSNVVTTAADSAENYVSKLFSRDWLVEKGHYDVVPKALKIYTENPPKF